MEKGTVDQIWKKVFLGCCGAAIVLLIPGLALQLSPALYLALGALAAGGIEEGLQFGFQFLAHALLHLCPGLHCLLGFLL